MLTWFPIGAGGRDCVPAGSAKLRINQPKVNSSDVKTMDYSSSKPQMVTDHKGRTSQTGTHTRRYTPPNSGSAHPCIRQTYFECLRWDRSRARSRHTPHTCQQPDTLPSRQRPHSGHLQRPATLAEDVRASKVGVNSRSTVARRAEPWATCDPWTRPDTKSVYSMGWRRIS